MTGWTTLSNSGVQYESLILPPLYGGLDLHWGQQMSPVQRGIFPTRGATYEGEDEKKKKEESERIELARERDYLKRALERERDGKKHWDYSESSNKKKSTNFSTNFVNLE